MKWKEYSRRLWIDISSLGSLVSFFVFMITLLLFKQYTIVVRCVGFLIIATLLTASLRLIHYKDRPRKRSHFSLVDTIDAGSFPSLHATRIFFIATLLINSSYYVLFYGIAVVVAYARIQLEEHEWKDVVVGAIIGVVLGLVL